jgi:hypothetical protein
VSRTCRLFNNCRKEKTMPIAWDGAALQAARQTAVVRFLAVAEAIKQEAGIVEHRLTSGVPETWDHPRPRRPHPQATLHPCPRMRACRSQARRQLQASTRRGARGRAVGACRSAAARGRGAKVDDETSQGIRRPQDPSGQAAGSQADRCRGETLCFLTTAD